MHCGQSVQLLNVKLVVHHVTSRLLKINYVLYCTGIILRTRRDSAASL